MGNIFTLRGNIGMIKASIQIIETPVKRSKFYWKKNLKQLITKNVSI